MRLNYGCNCRRRAESAGRVRTHISRQFEETSCEKPERIIKYRLDVLCVQHGEQPQHDKERHKQWIRVRVEHHDPEIMKRTLEDVDLKAAKSKSHQRALTKQTHGAALPSSNSGA